MDRLPEREKGVLQTAAVIGKEFAESILLAATEQPAEEVREALRSLKESEFVYEQALYPVVEYAFKHPLTQEVALGSQLEDRRRRTHAAVAKAIEQANSERLEASAALLAHHWEAAGDAPVAARWHATAAAVAGLSDVDAALDHWRPGARARESRADRHARVRSRAGRTAGASRGEDVVNCPGCGHDNRAGAQFCEECGARFARSCASCNTELRAGAKFCDACGSPTETGESGKASEPQRSPRDYTPKHLADKILQSKSALEIRF